MTAGPDEPGLGTTLAGFRIDRLIGAGASGTVYEATQISLRRRVALRVIDAKSLSPSQAARFDEEQRRYAALDHPGLVPTYEAGESDGVHFVAMRYLQGGTLASSDSSGRTAADQAGATLTGALAAAHAAGLVHGRVASHNVHLDDRGNAYLADFGLGRNGDPDADRRALAAVLSRARASQRQPSRSAARIVAVAGSCAVLVAGGLALAGSRGDEAAEAPPVPPDSVALGSDLAGPYEAVGCAPNPSPNTPMCTFAQEGQAVERSGTIRQWAIAGAEGELALQVVRESAGRTYVAGFTQPVQVDEPAPRAFPANLRVQSGDRLAVQLGSGATIGAASADDEAVRWDGELPDTPSRVESETFAGELQLRVALAEGALPEDPPGSTGRAARRAPKGEALGHLDLPAGRGEVARVSLVRVDEVVAVDLRLDGVRISRIEIVEANPSGSPVEFIRCGVGRSFCLRWLNPGAPSALYHQFELTPGAAGIRLVG